MICNLNVSLNVWIILIYLTLLPHQIGIIPVNLKSTYVRQKVFIILKIKNYKSGNNPDKVNESEINLESTGLVDECLNRLSSTELNKIICSGLFRPIGIPYLSAQTVEFLDKPISK